MQKRKAESLPKNQCDAENHKLKHKHLAMQMKSIDSELELNTNI